MRIRPIRRLATFALAICGFGAPSLASARDGPSLAPDSVATGEVAGTITLAMPTERPPRALSPYARRRYEPPVAAQSTASPDNVVVYVITGGPQPAASRGEASVLQRQRTILPHVSAVRAGARVDFPNEDEVFHNLFSLSGPRPFNLGRYAPGDQRSVTFERAGVVRIFCDIHSEMSATILVLDTPYFTSPDKTGNYRIPNLPDGRHTLFAWHESAGTVSVEIVVTGGRATHADLRLPADAK